jgi:epoxyqueuosine reductase
LDAPEGLRDLLANKCQELGFAAFGVAPATSLEKHQEFLEQWLEAGYHGPLEYMKMHLALRAHPERLLEGARSVLCVVADYGAVASPRSEVVPPEAGPGGKVARFARLRDYHIVLKKRLRKLGNFLVSRVPGSRFRVLVDSAPLLERAYAWRAGLGFFGKNSMLLTPGVGSYTLLGELLTDLELPPDSPMEGTCGHCTRCLDACPTGAIVAPGRVDAARCISCWNIEVRGPLPGQADLAGWAFGCDLCQEICPYNFSPSHVPLGRDFSTPRAAGAYLEAQEVLALEDQAAFLKRFAGTSLMRARWLGMRRNMQRLVSSEEDEGAV